MPHLIRQSGATILMGSKVEMGVGPAVTANILRVISTKRAIQKLSTRLSL